jgi:hypothetical protein
VLNSLKEEGVGEKKGGVSELKLEVSHSDGGNKDDRSNPFPIQKTLAQLALKSIKRRRKKERRRRKKEEERRKKERND